MDLHPQPYVVGQVVLVLSVTEGGWVQAQVTHAAPNGDIQVKYSSSGATKMIPKDHQAGNVKPVTSGSEGALRRGSPPGSSGAPAPLQFQPPAPPPYQPPPQYESPYQSPQYEPYLQVRKADEPGWAKEFQSWKLLKIAGTRVGKQAAVLLFLFYKICTWNSKNHILLMNCRRDVLGGAVYACEGTKAFVRCFPLFAASMAMIMTGRYILQYRIYYHFLLKNVFLDFTNHDIKKDLTLMAVMACFFCSMLHFLLDWFFPPYLSLDKLTIVLTEYLIPCGVFFILMNEASDVERRMCPLAKFVEEDTPWAKQHIANSYRYLDTSIKHNFKKAERKLYFEKPDHRFELDELLDEIIRISKPVDYQSHDEPNHGDVQHGVHGLYKGLWPGRILLNPYLKDAESKNFKKAFMVFTSAFIVFQCILVGALTVSAVQEALDAREGGVPHDAFHAGGEAFERMGFKGYCRDEGQRRPPGYFLAIDKLEGQVLLGTKAALSKRTSFRHSGTLRTHLLVDSHPRGTRSCASHCATREVCIGFAVDHDLCNIYLDRDAETPSGWDSLNAIHRTAAVHHRRNWAIVTTDHSMGATCYVKVEQASEPENLIGCLVYAGHIVVVLWLVYVSAWKTFKGYFAPLS